MLYQLSYVGAGAIVRRVGRPAPAGRASGAAGTIMDVSDRARAGGSARRGARPPGPGEKPLPRLERGRDLSRILAFTDGVFAIAITLLVLQIEVPVDATSASDLLEKLGDQQADLIAFAISFVVIGSFWIGNHRFMRTVQEFDRGLMFLLLLYLGVMVLVPFTSQLMGEYSDEFPVSILFYIINLTAIALAGALMMKHALRRGLTRPEYEWDLELSYRSSLLTALVFAASSPLVFVLGSWTPLVWFVLRWDPYQRRRDRVYEGQAKPRGGEGRRGDGNAADQA